jgi:hypothetical protein
MGLFTGPSDKPLWATNDVNQAPSNIGWAGPFKHVETVCDAKILLQEYTKTTYPAFY